MAMWPCMGSQIYDLPSVIDHAIDRPGGSENPIQIGHAIDQPARSAMQSNSQPDQCILAMHCPRAAKSEILISWGPISAQQPASRPASQPATLSFGRGEPPSSARELILL